MLAYHLQDTLQSLGMENAALHPFRHMAASELLEQGPSPTMVQREMRHINLRIPPGKCPYVISGAQRRAVDSLTGQALG